MHSDVDTPFNWRNAFVLVNDVDCSATLSDVVPLLETVKTR